MKLPEEGFRKFNLGLLPDQVTCLSIDWIDHKKGLCRLHFNFRASNGRLWYHYFMISVSLFETDDDLYKILNDNIQSSIDSAELRIKNGDDDRP